MVQQVLWTHLQPVFVADSKRFQARRGQWTGEQSLTELIKDLEDEDSEGSDLVGESDTDKDFQTVPEISTFRFQNDIWGDLKASLNIR